MSCDHCVDHDGAWEVTAEDRARMREALAGDPDLLDKFRRLEYAARYRHADKCFIVANNAGRWHEEIRTLARRLGAVKRPDGSEFEAAIDAIIAMEKAVSVAGPCLDADGVPLDLPLAVERVIAVAVDDITSLRYAVDFGWRYGGADVWCRDYGAERRASAYSTTEPNGYAWGLVERGHLIDQRGVKVDGCMSASQAMAAADRAAASHWGELPGRLANP